MTSPASSTPANDLIEKTYVEHASASPFAPTLRRVEELIEAAGLTIFARIDHAEAARSVGLAMPPTTVLIYGNPRGGTPAMLAAPLVALDLPLRVLIREGEDGRVLIAWHPIGEALRRAGIANDLAARLEAAQSLMEKATVPKGA